MSMEKIYEAIKSILQEHLQEELEAVNANYIAEDMRNFGESLALPTPDNESYFLEDNNIPVGLFPGIVMEFPVEDEDIRNCAVKISGGLEVYVNDIGDGRVARIVRRYIYGIVNVLRKHNTLDGVCKSLLTTSRGFGAFKRLTDGAFFRVGGLDLTIKITY